MSKELIFGINAVKSRLGQGAAGIEKLIIRAGLLSTRLQRVQDLAVETGCRIERVGDDVLSRMTAVNHQGVGLAMRLPSVKNEEDLYTIVEQQPANLLLLVLDGVTDPRNLGACIRSAATLGVHAVVVPKDNSAPLNDAAVKTASGGASHVPLIQVTNLGRCLSQLQKQGVWVVGTLLETDHGIADVDMTGNIALVMGSEEKGLRKKTIQCCDFLAKIPMLNESFGFNVSVATGICLYEIGRQRE